MSPATFSHLIQACQFWQSIPPRHAEAEPIQTSSFDALFGAKHFELNGLAQIINFE